MSKICKTHKSEVEKTVRAIRKWCAERDMKLTTKPRHVHPRAYVLGYAAPQCLVIASPWMDSEPHLREFDKRNPLTTVNCFDPSLRAGDWCMTAYVRREGVGEQVAIPIEEKP